LMKRANPDRPNDSAMLMMPSGDAPR
jgi:hypothetical protein